MWGRKEAWKQYLLNECAKWERTLSDPDGREADDITDGMLSCVVWVLSVIILRGSGVFFSSIPDLGIGTTRKVK